MSKTQELREKLFFLFLLRQDDITIDEILKVCAEAGLAFANEETDVPNPAPNYIDDWLRGYRRAITDMLEANFRQVERIEV